MQQKWYMCNLQQQAVKLKYKMCNMKDNCHPRKAMFSQIKSYTLGFIKQDKLHISLLWIIPWVVVCGLWLSPVGTGNRMCNMDILLSNYGNIDKNRDKLRLSMSPSYTNAMAKYKVNKHYCD